MTKNRVILCALMALISFSANAIITQKGDKVVLTQKSVSLIDLLADYAQMEGINIIKQEGLRDVQIRVLGNQEFSKADFKVFLSFELFTNNLALVRDNQGFYELISARDIRYKSLPTFDKIEDVPNDYHYVHFVYQSKYIEIGSILKNLRPLVSRFGRIIELKSSNQVVLFDVAKNVKRLNQIIEQIDTQRTLTDKAELEKINEKFKKLSSHKENIWQHLDKYQLYFLITFSLIFLVIGFMVRGFVIRRIEGGL